MKKIIGIVGPIGSGKDTAAEFIGQKIKTKVFTISQFLKEIAAKRGIEPTRENLIKLGTQTGLDQGEDYLARIVLEKVSSTGVLAGIRFTKIIEFLKANSEFILIAVSADPQIRFQRAQARDRLGEASTFEEFIANEQKENSAPNIQRVFECMKMAKYQVGNDGTQDEFYIKLEEILKKEKLI